MLFWNLLLIKNFIKDEPLSQSANQCLIMRSSEMEWIWNDERSSLTPAVSGPFKSEFR